MAAADTAREKQPGGERFAPGAGSADAEDAARAEKDEERAWIERFCARVNTGPEGPATARALLAISPTIRRLMRRFGRL